MRSRLVALFVTTQFVVIGCTTATDFVNNTASTVVDVSADDSTTASSPDSTVLVTTAPTTSPPTTLLTTATSPSATLPSSAPPTTSSTLPAKGESSSPNSFAATDVLAQLEVAREVGSGYDRDLFRHWVDNDGDGCDTRQEVLIRDSRSTPQIDPYRCKVIAGNWYSPYDGAVWEDPSDVDIDHVVALKEAWDSGAWQWSSERRRAFANDLSDSRSLMAVTDSVNQSKSDKDPSQWMPPRRDYRCIYISLWLAVKARWSLTVDPSEEGMIRVVLQDECRGLRVAKWAPVPIT